MKLIQKKVDDKDAVWLVERIIGSFEPGLPLGNVTSQIFSNIYLNELDWFIKHKLKIKYYLRYCDDFIILSEDKECLEKLIQKVGDFLEEDLKLTLHPDKIIIRKWKRGIDFLGYVALPHYRVLRTKTKKRILKKIKQKKLSLDKKMISQKSFETSVQSYFGVLKHCRGYKIKKKINFIS